jgi:hypothetical protein
MATAKTDDLCEEERVIHAEFDLDRVRGEWFMLNEERLGLILKRFEEIEGRANKSIVDLQNTVQ